MRVTYATYPNLTELAKATGNGHAKSGAFRSVPHPELAVEVLAACVRRGWSAGSPEATVSNDQSEMLARFVADTPDGPILIGVANYRNNERAITLAAGERYYANCTGDNSIDVWLAERPIRRFNRVRLHVDAEADWALGELEIERRRWNNKVKRLQKAEMADAQIGGLLFAAMRGGLVPSGRIKQIDERLWGEQKTGWELLKAFAAVAKQSPPGDQVHQVLRFGALLFAELKIKE